MIVDKLYETVEEFGPVCLGLDTALDYLPEHLKREEISDGEKVFRFNMRIIDATADVVACYKVQIAYYEALGLDGLSAYAKTVQYIRQKGKLVIADVKRGDIADTAKMYAKAHYSGSFESDFMTLNPYMGLDTIEPFRPYIEEKEKGLFVLVKTSNKGSRDFQMLDLKEENKLYQYVGEKINQLAIETAGQYGYGSVGAVVGCTNLGEAVNAREIMKNTFFLVPGYGAQGGTAKDVATLFVQKNGCVVNSSRGILLAYRKQENGWINFEKHARDAAILMRDDILNEL